MNNAGPSKKNSQQLFTFKSGGWVLAVAAMPVIIIMIWALAPVVLGTATTDQQGDGQHIESYGFDLSRAIVERNSIVIGSASRDSINALSEPRMISVAEVDHINAEERGKYLVGSDRVIGVVVGSVSRAYPIRMLVWHEIVNDVIEGQHIAVTYSGLCDSAAVYNATLSNADMPLEFGVSGLLRNSNLLMYDRQDDSSQDSLWSQIDGRAIAGPAAHQSKSLELLPSVVMHWDDWKALHPTTEVMAPNPDPLLEKYYKRRAYGDYSSSDILRFPVAPLPPAESDNSRPLKDRIVAVQTSDEQWHAISIADLEGRVVADDIWPMKLSDGSTIYWHFSSGDIQTAWATDEAGAFLPSAHAFWFAWYAAYPDLLLK